MKHLTPDEIASALIARLIREVQHFAASSTIYECAGTEEMWAHFLNHLTSKKNLERHQ
jgi:hypothetical protein